MKVYRRPGIAAAVLAAALAAGGVMPGTAFAGSAEASESALTAEAVSGNDTAAEQPDAAGEQTGADLADSEADEAALTGASGTASVGSQSYASVAAAVAAAAEGDTVRLTSDADLSSEGLTVEAGKKITLDTNGYTLTLANSKTGTLYVKGDLTILDSAGDGKITTASAGDGCSQYNYVALITVTEGGSLTVEDGAYITTPVISSATSGDRSYYGIGVGNGTLTVNGGKIETGGVAVKCLDKSGASNIGIKASQYTGGCSVAIHGGEVISTANTAIYTGNVSKTDRVEISGGTVTGYAAAVRYVGGILNISSGKISSSYDQGDASSNTNGEGCAVFSLPTASSAGSVEISGGTFSAPLNPDCIYDQTMHRYNYYRTSYSITGGTFTSDLSQRYGGGSGDNDFCLLSDDYKCTANGDGTWTVAMKDGTEPTPTPRPTATPAPTATPLPATVTPVPTATPLPATVTPVPTATPLPATATPAPTEAPTGDARLYSDIDLDGKPSA